MTDIASRGIQRPGAREFRGIRFATAERLAAPVDADGVFDDTDATTFGPQAPQIGGVLERILGGDELAMDEDCHFLNVFTPRCDDVRRPVLVWIHGGAFVTGTGAMPWYDGAPLAARGDVVVVTINYRLGALGFLGDHNVGSLDQISALRWVQRHIRDFGGDPDNVTIFGESAGGSSVVSLLAAPAARDLFHAAWAMSPSILQLRTSAQGASLRERYLELLDDDVESADLGDILEAQTKMPVAAGLQNFAPTDGTDVFPSPILETSAMDDRPLVIGANTDEMLLFTAFDQQRSGWTDDDVQREFGHRFGHNADHAIAMYRTHRPDVDPSQLVSAMQTDELFRRPAQRLAEARVAASSSTWMYSFEQRSTAFGGMLGCCHGLDIPFAFDTIEAQGVEMFTGDGPDRSTVADQFASALVSFARNHAPGWDRFDVDRRPTQRIGPDPSVIHDPEPALRELWT